MTFKEFVDNYVIPTFQVVLICEAAYVVWLIPNMLICATDKLCTTAEKIAKNGGLLKGVNINNSVLSRDQ